MQWQELSVDTALSIAACAEGAGGSEGCASALGFGTTASAAWPNQARPCVIILKLLVVRLSPCSHMMNVVHLPPACILEPERLQLK